MLFYRVLKPLVPYIHVLLRLRGMLFYRVLKQRARCADATYSLRGMLFYRVLKPQTCLNHISYWFERYAVL